MLRRTWTATVVGSFSVCAALGGCASGVPILGGGAEASCVGPEANVPPAATAGDSITLNVTNVWADCYDTGQAGNPPTLHEITVTLHNTTPDAAVSVTAPVTTDAKATVVLEIPATASGRYVVATDGTVLGELTVNPAS